MNDCFLKICTFLLAKLEFTHRTHAQSWLLSVNLMIFTNIWLSAPTIIMPINAIFMMISTISLIARDYFSDKTIIAS